VEIQFKLYGIASTLFERSGDVQPFHTFVKVNEQGGGK
jgi:hypothetical protein